MIEQGVLQTALTLHPTVLLISVLIILGTALFAKSVLTPVPKGLPPVLKSNIPFLGSVVEFGKDPIRFLHGAYKKNGEIFCFKMFGRYCVYLIGSDAAAMVFNSKNDILNAEDVYANLTVPVFGKGVAYDVDNKIFSEQKRMLKTGLIQTRLKTYVPLIEQETNDYFDKHWGKSGTKDLFAALAEVIILTASRCLLGDEIRALMDAKVATLYHDLDGGFTSAAWLLPNWLPLPSFRRRDRAHLKIKEIFYEVIRARRALPEDAPKKEDMLQFLMETTYKDGRPLTDDEVAGLLIGLLMAGQHTSSTTSAWLGFFLAKNPEIQQTAFEEQYAEAGISNHSEQLPPIDSDNLDSYQYLDRCLKETLRMRPPILTMMRMSREPIAFKNYVIPDNTYVCVSPTINHIIDDVWEEPFDFKPDRFINHKDLTEDTSSTTSNRFAYVPFGAGRHRCIGEHFAYVQIKTIWSVLLRKYTFELPDGKFPEIDFTTLIHTPKAPFVHYKSRQ